MRAPVSKKELRAALLAVLLSIAAPACSASAASDALIARLERLSEAGNGEASYHLGMAYHLGAGVNRDIFKALAAFRRAAQQGDPLGAYKLGCYLDGQGEGAVRFDPDQALRYKLVAAEAGYALAQQDVAALLYRQNRTSEAIAWIGKAAAQGWPDALLMQASLFDGLPKVIPDPVMAAASFRLVLLRENDNAAARARLEAIEKRMTAGQRAAADVIVRDYRPQPTALTLKALSGQEAAQRLIASTR